MSVHFLESNETVIIRSPPDRQMSEEEIEERAQLFLVGFEHGTSRKPPERFYVMHEAKHISEAYKEGHAAGREARIKTLKDYGEKIGYYGY